MFPNLQSHPWLILSFRLWSLNQAATNAQVWVKFSLVGAFTDCIITLCQAYHRPAGVSLHALHLVVHVFRRPQPLLSTVLRWDFFSVHTITVLVTSGFLFLTSQFWCHCFETVAYWFSWKHEVENNSLGISSKTWFVFEDLHQLLVNFLGMLPASIMALAVLQPVEPFPIRKFYLIIQRLTY